MQVSVKRMPGDPLTGGPGSILPLEVQSVSHSK